MEAACRRRCGDLPTAILLRHEPGVVVVEHSTTAPQHNPAACRFAKPRRTRQYSSRRRRRRSSTAGRALKTAATGWQPGHLLVFNYRPVDTPPVGDGAVFVLGPLEIEGAEVPSAVASTFTSRSEHEVHNEGRRPVPVSHRVPRHVAEPAQRQECEPALPVHGWRARR
jgi:hypothetical protein